MNPTATITPSKPQSSPITILFENPLKSYIAGEMVTGTVVFQAEKDQSVQTFAVYLRGEFYSTKGDTQEVENILVESSPLDYRGAGEGNIEMHFTLLLKPTSPTSIQTPLGGIRYHVMSSVIFKENDSTKMAEASEPISVNHPLQLPDSCSGRQVRTIERGGLICCIGSISAELGVSSAFLLSGQAVIINGSVFNGTHSSVQATSINLVQSLQRQKDGKKMRRTVTSLQKGAVLPGKRQEWPSDFIIVPPLPPTTANPFFKTWYEIIMEIQKVSGKVFKLKIPVVIGNLSATESSFPTSDSGNEKIKWKSSEPQNGTNEFMPLYITHVA